MTELKQLTNSVLIAGSVSVAIQTIPHFYQGAASGLAMKKRTQKLCN